MFLFFLFLICEFEWFSISLASASLQHMNGKFKSFVWDGRLTDQQIDFNQWTSDEIARN